MLITVSVFPPAFVLVKVVHVAAAVVVAVLESIFACYSGALCFRRATFRSCE